MDDLKTQTISSWEIDESQKKVVAYLASPDSTAYTDPDLRALFHKEAIAADDTDTHIDLVATHSAFIFLGKDIVYKIKRIVNYSYLDTRKLEARRAYCERELQLNKPLLPDIYIDVVPVLLDRNGELNVSGQGTPVEWALRMKRFDEACVLENIARSDQLTLQMSMRLGISIAKFHNGLVPLVSEDGYERMAEIVDELFLEFSHLATILTPGSISEFTAVIKKQLVLHKAKLNQRSRDGFVRRCHGDLHLRNILIHNEVPVPFDALEFSERLATCDILYDFAFLLMDIGNHALYEQQNQLLNSYLLHTSGGTIDALGLLGFFLSCRAAIKAMTTAQQANMTASASDDSLDEIYEAKTAEAREYLRSAITYASPAKPLLIAIGGLSGTGKSTIARALASRVAKPPGAILIHSDAERKINAGVALQATLPASFYTKAVTEKNYRDIMEKAYAALLASQTVIVDSTFIGSDQRIAIERLAHRADAQFAGLWLQADEATLRERVAARRNDMSDATVNVLESQMSKSHGEIDWLIIDSTQSLDKSLCSALTQLRHSIKLPQSH